MFLERIGAQVVTFIVSLVVARILVPSDFGIVATAQIFINLANVFVVNGINASLIQMKQPSDEDYSTAFYANLLLSVVLYGAVFISAPHVAAFYGNDLLGPIFRVLGLRLIIGALNAIQRAYVSKQLLFKKFFYSTLFGTVVSGVVGITMALKGMGAWAIVGQYLTNTLIDTIVLWITVKWRPKRVFSVTKLKSILSFGTRVFGAAFLNQLYLELRSLVIGKKYSGEDLAYYNRGNSIPQMFYTNIVSAITSVMFPVLVTQVEDSNAFVHGVRKSIRMCCYVLFPLMGGLLLVSRPLLLLILTNKWENAIIYMQIHCLCYAVLPIQSVIEQAYKSIGRGDLLLKTFAVEKILGILSIVLALPIGVLAIAYGMLFTSFISTFIHAIPLRRTIGYRLKDLLEDVWQPFVFTFAMAVTVYAAGLPFRNLFAQLIVQTLVGIAVYFILSVLFKSDSMATLIDIVNGRTNKKFKLLARMLRRG